MAQDIKQIIDQNESKQNRIDPNLLKGLAIFGSIFALVYFANISLWYVLFVIVTTFGGIFIGVTFTIDDFETKLDEVKAKQNPFAAILFTFVMFPILNSLGIALGGIGGFVVGIFLSITVHFWICGYYVALQFCFMLLSFSLFAISRHPKFSEILSKIV